jgi:hypothetical protein
MEISLNKNLSFIPVEASGTESVPVEIIRSPLVLGAIILKGSKCGISSPYGIVLRSFYVPILDHEFSRISILRITL